jgi:hypothetical protein
MRIGRWNVDAPMAHHLAFQGGVRTRLGSGFLSGEKTVELILMVLG